MKSFKWEFGNKFDLKRRKEKKFKGCTAYGISSFYVGNLYVDTSKTAL